MQRQIQQHIVAGQIPEALAIIEQAAPGTLGSHPRIKFQLQCQQFVEMVSTHSEVHICMCCRDNFSGQTVVRMAATVINTELMTILSW